MRPENDSILLKFGLKSVYKHNEKDLVLVDCLKQTLDQVFELLKVKYPAYNISIDVVNEPLYSHVVGLTSSTIKKEDISYFLKQHNIHIKATAWLIPQI